MEERQIHATNIMDYTNKKFIEYIKDGHRLTDDDLDDAIDQSAMVGEETLSNFLGIAANLLSAYYAGDISFEEMIASSMSLEKGASKKK